MRRTRSGRGGGLRPVPAGTSAPVGVAPGRPLALGPLGAAAGGALVGDVLAKARTVDVDPERVHGEPVEDGGGERGVAEVAAQSLSAILEDTAVEARPC